MSRNLPLLLRWLDEPNPAPPPVTVVVKVPPREAPVPDVRTSPMPDPEVIRNFDWDQVNLTTPPRSCAS